MRPDARRFGCNGSMEKTERILVIEDDTDINDVVATSTRT